MDSTLFPLPNGPGMPASSLIRDLMKLLADFEPIRHDEPSQLRDGGLAVRIYFSTEEQLNGAESWHYLNS
jgi:hypothetical protein